MGWVFGRLLLAFAMVISTLASSGTAASAAEEGDSIMPGCYAASVGTDDDALGIASSVGEVCFDSPRVEVRSHIRFFSVDIYIDGVDWSPWVFDGAHYPVAYEDLHLKLWWPENWGRGNRPHPLLQYQYSGSGFGFEGESLIGLGAVQQGMAYVAQDGFFETGNGVFTDGPLDGEPSILASSALTRDVAAVASDWLEQNVGKAPDVRYLSGYSFGGAITTGVLSGDLFGFIPVPGNQTDLGDLNSPPFYDGALYINGHDGPTPSFGSRATSVPQMWVVGEQDPGLLSTFDLVAGWTGLSEAGKERESVALWSLRGQAHGMPEVDTDIFGIQNDHDLISPILAAALEELDSAVQADTAMDSYFGGEVVARDPGAPVPDCAVGLSDPARMIQWHTVDGETTTLSPVVFHSDDVYDFDLEGSAAPVFGPPPREACSHEIDSFEVARSALGPRAAIVPPLAANRVGPHTFDFFITLVTPGEQFAVCDVYTDLTHYTSDLKRSAKSLEQMGVWRPLTATDGTRTTAVFEPPPGFTVPGPFPGIEGTFAEQGCP